MKTIIVAVCIVALVAVVGVGAFFAGSQYGQQQANTIRSAFLSQRQGGGGNAAGAFNQNGQAGTGGRPAASGTVSSMSTSG